MRLNLNPVSDAQKVLVLQGKAGPKVEQRAGDKEELKREVKEERKEERRLERLYHDLDFTKCVEKLKRMGRGGY